MKLIKKPLALVLAVMMIMAVLVVPASATTSAWRGYFQKFAVTKRTSYQTVYAKAVQSILLGFGESHNDVANHGGVDGSFGTYTEKAVKSFQSAKSLDPDGSVGPATWGKMADVMDDYRDGSTIRFWTQDADYVRNAITAVYANGVYNFYYHNTAGSKDGQFASVY